MGNSICFELPGQTDRHHNAEAEFLPVRQSRWDFNIGLRQDRGERQLHVIHRVVGAMLDGLGERIRRFVPLLLQAVDLTEGVPSLMILGIDGILHLRCYQSLILEQYLELL